MFTEKDSIKHVLECSYRMVVRTIEDIHSESEAGPLTSEEMCDLHHCIETLKDIYSVSEMHDVVEAKYMSKRCPQ